MQIIGNAIFVVITLFVLQYTKNGKKRKVIKIQNEIKEIMERLDKYVAKPVKNPNPFRVLITTILSQRTRDENTDEAAATLFSVYKTPAEIANAPTERIEKLIKKAGFFRVKAKRVKEVSRIIHEDYDDVVPCDINKLLGLPGVGRKTANCVLVYGFRKNAIPVDVHVHRISNRLGLVDTKNPDETEFELAKIVPECYWRDLNEKFVRFGQDICRPIGPKHEECPITDLCDFYNES
jgi:endonuclease-3